MSRILVSVYILTLFLAVSLTSIKAQSSIVGHLFDLDQKPIAYATVQLKGEAVGAISDTAGYFEINELESGSYTLQVHALGYQFPETELVLAKDETRVLQLASTDTGFALDEVVVSATLKEVSKLDSPIPVEVYSDKFFKANPTPSVFESLQNVNGVRPQLNCNVCNTGDIHINGLEGPYTMVLIDGMPIVSGLSTVYGLTGIPQSLIERVEVVKGPASTLYGSEAVGGLINVITKKVGNAPKYAVDIFANNWGEVNTDLGMRFDVGSNANGLLGINHFYYQNPIDNNGDGFTDLTLQHRFSAFNKWAFQRKSGKLFSLAARYIYEDRWGGQMEWKKENRGGDEVYGESIYTNRWETFGTYQLPTAENIFLSFSANGHKQNSFYGDVPYHAKQYVSFGQLSWNKQLGANHDVTLGIAYRETWYDDNTPATASLDSVSNQPAINRLPGIFVQDEWSMGTQHKILMGLRYDRNSVHGNIFSPRLNYKYTSRDKMSTLRIGVGNGYRVANVFTEDHAALTGAREVVFAETLLPETSWNGNLNFVQQFFFANNTSLNVDATAFYTYFNNRIVPDYETNPNQIIYDNLDGNAVSKGISLDLEIETANGISVLLGGTIQDVSITENGITERQLLTEQWSAVWNIGYKLPVIDVAIDYTGNIYGPMRLPLLSELDERAAESPVWSVQNIQLSRSFGNTIEVYGGVKNLLDFTPAANSIARAFDPFDREVVFGADGQVVPTTNNPQALTFDPSYVYAPNQGIRFFLGARFTVK